MSIETGFDKPQTAPRLLDGAATLAGLIPSQTHHENGCEGVTYPEGSLAHYAEKRGLNPSSVIARVGWDRLAAGLVEVDYSN